MRKFSAEKIENLRSKLKVINSNIVEARNTQKVVACHQFPRSITPSRDLLSPRSELQKLQKENKQLVAAYREKEDEVTRLSQMVEELQQQLKVSKAKHRAISIGRSRDSNKENEPERWDDSFDRLYHQKIKRLL